MRIIVGLGNPGKEYEKTRHNVGFLVLDELLKKRAPEQSWQLEKKFQSEIALFSVKNEKLLLIKPLTYMNDSGAAVQKVLHFYKAKPEDLVVVHDDKDIVLGEIKIQKDRGSAGHNGIKSLITYLNTQNFTRIRVGIRSQNEKKMKDVPKFVLGKFGILEKNTIKKSIDAAVEAILYTVNCN